MIAIENVRLFDEVQARTARAAAKSLQQQTATADVLKVISRSTFDLQTGARHARRDRGRLCAADKALIARMADGRLPVSRGCVQCAAEHIQCLSRTRRSEPDRGIGAGRVALERRTVHIPMCWPTRTTRWTADRQAGGYRTVLGVPLLREGELIGVLVLSATEGRAVSPTSRSSWSTTFADQAVIAIENVRLFEEVQARTEDLSEVAAAADRDRRRAQGHQPLDLRPADGAAHAGRIGRAAVRGRQGDDHASDGRRVLSRRSYGFSPEFIELRQDHPGRRRSAARSPGARCSKARPSISPTCRPTPNTPSSRRQKLGGFRTMLGVPMLREGDADRRAGADAHRGAARSPTSRSSWSQTFADQAVIAIENVRLFEEVQARTRELSRSLEDLRTAQDRLVQTEKLASLGQLTAGIAHEIKNPLNFVNNFSALSVELIDELQRGAGRRAARRQDARPRSTN